MYVLASCSYKSNQLNEIIDSQSLDLYVALCLAWRVAFVVSADLGLKSALRAEHPTFHF